MKIKVSFTIDIDPESWAENYGISRHNVREDVQRFYMQYAKEHARFTGNGEAEREAVDLR